MGEFGDKLTAAKYQIKTRAIFSILKKIQKTFFSKINIINFLLIELENEKYILLHYQRGPLSISWKV